MWVSANLKYIPEGNLGKSLFTWQPYTCSLVFPWDTKNGLLWEDTMVSHERILWSPMRGYYGLLWEDTMVSYERILWSHMRVYYGLTWEYTMVYWWKILSALCRTAGSGSRRFRMSCKTLSHGIFLEISLSIDWFFSVVIDMNTSKAPPWLVRYAHKYTIKSKKVANQKATFSVCIWRQTW